MPKRFSFSLLYYLTSTLHSFLTECCLFGFIDTLTIYFRFSFLIIKLTLYQSLRFFMFIIVDLYVIIYNIHDLHIVTMFCFCLLLPIFLHKFFDLLWLSRGQVCFLESGSIGALVWHSPWHYSAMSVRCPRFDLKERTEGLGEVMTLGWFCMRRRRWWPLYRGAGE